MIIDRKDKKEKRIEIDLNGPEGNVFCLFGLAREWGRSLSMSKKEVDDIIEEAKSTCNYDGVVKTLDKYFGEWVIFYK
jgi:hypothetical protein